MTCTLAVALALAVGAAGAASAGTFVRGTHAAAATAFDAVENFHQTGQTNQDVDDRFHCRPAADKKIHDVQIGICEKADTDEAPVEGADNDQCAYDFAAAAVFISVTHRRRGERGIITA